MNEHDIEQDLDRMVRAIELITPLRDERSVLLAIAVNALDVLGYHELTVAALARGQREGTRSES